MFQIVTKPRRNILKSSWEKYVEVCVRVCMCVWGGGGVGVYGREAFYDYENFQS